jgi:hypothetical protein
MNAEHVIEPKNQANGVVRMPRRGMVQFAFGDDAPFTFDAIEVWDAFVVFDTSNRNEKGEVPTDQLVGYGLALRSFVQNTVTDAGKACGVNPPQLTNAEARIFIGHLREEVEKLRSFFAPKSAEQPLSPPRQDIKFEM